MIKTFLDAGVLISAATGTRPDTLAALNILSDPNREFCATSILELEVKPKAIYHKRRSESLIYEAYFSDVTEWISVDDNLLDDAYKIAENYGLAAVDALHAAAAIIAGADEFITTEKSTKPLFRIKGLNVLEL